MTGYVLPSEAEYMARLDRDYPGQWAVLPAITNPCRLVVCGRYESSTEANRFLKLLGYKDSGQAVIVPELDEPRYDRRTTLRFEHRATPIGW